MIYVGYAPLDVDITQEIQIHPDDVLDAVNTLTLSTKVCIPIAPPGEGPDHFLRWANDELADAEATLGDAPDRKAFNCSVLAKCAMECLIDWYMDHFLLNRTLNPHAGLVKMLEALKASERFGIGLSLFTAVMFEPRNDAIHSYEPVDLVLVRKSVELANLTVRNCSRAVPPGLAPVFYGTIELVQGRAAIEKMAEEDPKKATYLKNPDLDGLWLKNIGPKGEVSVLLDRNNPISRVLLLTSDGVKSATDVRFCPIDRAFGTERLQQLFFLLERPIPRSSM